MPDHKKNPCGVMPGLFLRFRRLLKMKVRTIEFPSTLVKTWIRIDLDFGMFFCPLGHDFRGPGLVRRWTI